MERGRGRGLAAVLVVLATIGGVLAPRAEAGLAITWKSNGLPGMPKGSSTEQRLLLGTSKFRIDDRTVADARSLIVRLDRGVYWELDPYLQEYTETTFAHMREQREAAEDSREKARDAALKKLSGDELDRWLEKNGLRKDGKRVIEVKKGGWERGADGARLQRVAIELNGVTQVAVWQTDKYEGDYKPPKELFEFFDLCGLFPADVSERVKSEVTLFPLRIKANIDHFSHGAEIDTRIDAVSHWTEEAARFEEPSSLGFKKVAQFSKEKVAKKEYRCPVCRKPIGDPREAQFAEKDKRTGEKVFLDSEECWKEFLASGRRTKPE